MASKSQQALILLISKQFHGIAVMSTCTLSPTSHQQAFVRLQACQSQKTSDASNHPDASGYPVEATTANSTALNTDAKSIMAKYDLTNITYADMAKLGKELVAAGALPENKLLDFIPIDPSRISTDGSIRESSNVPVNMIATQENMVASIKNFSGKGADYATMVLNMYKNFQTLHTQ